MKEFVEKLIGRLEELDRKTFRISPKDAIEIVNQLTEEYNNCSTNISTDKSTTNADRIRSMSDEELADFLSSINTGRDIGYDYFSAKGGIFIESNKNLIKKVQDWLQSERWE